MSARVFVSYASPDLKLVRELVAFLKSAGVHTWFDKDDLIAGQEWEKVIPEVIRGASVFLLCLSSQAVDRRGYFQKEIRLALNEAMTIPPKQLYMIPVKLDQCEIPEDIGRYHAVDLFEEKGIAPLLTALSHALKHDIDALPDADARLQAAIQTRVSPSIAIPKALTSQAKGLLAAILKDDRSDPKGLSLMLISQTQGGYVPYVWDNEIHGQLHPVLMNITRIRMAADELSEAGVLESLPPTGALKQYILRPEFENLSVDQSK
ncbi:MAG: toll/interleukin-1 receptor domain-containing protein [Terriglobia bacterium]